MVRVWLFVAVLLGVLGFAGWASDFVTMQGERTVYTAHCAGGAWQGDRCSGRVEAGKRFRFRALKPHHEVLFWTVASDEPSGKFQDCMIKDGRNWSCRPGPGADRTITLQMAQGAPVPGPATVTLPFRAVSKWRWLLLEQGITANGGVSAATVRASPLPG